MPESPDVPRFCCSETQTVFRVRDTFPGPEGYDRRRCAPQLIPAHASALDFGTSRIFYDAGCTLPQPGRADLLYGALLASRRDPFPQSLAAAFGGRGHS